MLPLLLIGMLTWAFNIQPVKSEPTTIIVPDDYPTIQEAINAANPGDTIYVNPGKYYEHIAVNKTVSLIGEDRDTTIIDGSRTGSVINIIADNVYITGFTIQNSSHAWRGCPILLQNCANVTIRNNKIAEGDSCIRLEYSDHNNILENIITNPDFSGIYLTHSSENNITGNIISMVSYGIEMDQSNNNTINDNMITEINWSYIRLASSSFNTLKNNSLSGAYPGARYFGVHGSSLEHFIQDIDETNTIAGKPIYYLVNQHDRQIPNDAGYVGVINSTNITVKDLTLRNNFQGVLFAYTNKSIIENVVISDQDCGIQLYFCDGNTINCSQITGCWDGLSMSFSNNNVLINNDVSRNSLLNVGIRYCNNNTIFGNIISFSRRPDSVGLGIEGNGNMICANDLYGNFNDVIIMNSSDNTICNNKIRDSFTGLGIQFSANNNEIYNNWITGTLHGLEIAWDTENNMIYHNNFIDNKKHAYIQGNLTNVWDNGYPSGGNYWSDYSGADQLSGPDQDQPRGDGIGDTSYIIDENNVDNYPLMGPFSSFNTSLGYSVDVVSNSTIQDFEYFEANSTIIMHVSNMTANQTYGFCRLTIPHELIVPPYNITVNDNPVEYNTIFENETISIIYFNYEHSTLEIIIIPEFPSTVILLLALIFTTSAVIIGKKKPPESITNKPYLD